MAPASAIRKKIINGEDISEFMPEKCLKIYNHEVKHGRAPIDYDVFRTLSLFKLRTSPSECYSLLPDASEGLDNRLMDAGRTASSYREVLESTKTKRYAMSRIRRMVLCSLLDITADMQKELPPYIRILAFNKRGREILHDIKSTATLPIITKPASAKKLSGFPRSVFEAEAKATDIYSLMCKNETYRRGGQEWVTDPIYYI
jgi:predicted nucleotidyltransferase